MFNDPLHWFPNAIMSNVFAVLVLGLFLLDATLQYRGARQRTGPARQRSDAGSLLVVNGSAVLSLIIAGGCRYAGLGVVTGWVQYVGIVGMVLAALLREWSVLTLGALFFECGGDRAGTQTHHYWSVPMAATSGLHWSTGVLHSGRAGDGNLDRSGDCVCPDIVRLALSYRD